MQNTIPLPTIPINLKKDNPSKVTASDLKKELNDIGLTCPLTKEEVLVREIKNTVNNFPKGKLEGYGFATCNRPHISEFMKKGYTSMALPDIVCQEPALHANWAPYDYTPCKVEIDTISYPDNFDYLKAYYRGFGGKVSENSYNNSNTTVEAIKKMFVQIALNISSTLVAGLNQDLMQAALVNILGPMPAESADYDSGIRNRIIYILEDYDGKECKAFGFISVQWRLIIKNYKQKKSSHQEGHLNVQVRTALYNDLLEPSAEYNYLLAHRKNLLFAPNQIPVDPEVKIFTQLPPANSDTFIRSLPLEQTEDHIIPVMVFYSPDLQNVGCLDNVDSDCETSYSKTITSGFSFTSSQKISGGLKFSAGTIFTKAELSISLELRLQSSGTIASPKLSFKVPARTKAFLYQGYLHGAVLNYDVKNMTFFYGETGRFLSNLVKTSDKPIADVPVIILKNTPGPVPDKEAADQNPPALWLELAKNCSGNSFS